MFVSHKRMRKRFGNIDARERADDARTRRESRTDYTDYAAFKIESASTHAQVKRALELV